MGDEEADKSTVEENSIPKINQILQKVAPCYNLNCQQPLPNVSDDEMNESDNIQPGNEEESKHKIQGMLICGNNSGPLYTT